MLEIMRTINLNNKYRVLLTETLPYELPLTLNNDGFYENMQKESLRNVFVEVFNGIAKQEAFTIPFDYNVRRFNGEKSRKLSLIHPLTQLAIVDFYEQYSGYLLKLCGKSPFSIRYIADKARTIFPIENGNDDDNEQDINGEERHIELKDFEIERLYRSYFTYKRYDLLYKFFDSGDNLRLEQKYKWLLKMDIASCFYHIYTHTVSWAVKGKEAAKSNIGKATFENEFDRLMQHTNYNETNGIVVGPEISRIFAEIILQSIDIAVLNSLKNDKYHLKLGQDYEVRRYVDDYYVYANSKETLDIIKDSFKEELEKYKLYLNKNKLEYFERPFVSEINLAKKRISNLVNEFKKDILTQQEGHYVRHVKGMGAFTRFSNDFRYIAKMYNQKYGQINRYLLSLLSKQVRYEKESGVKPAEDILLTYVDIAFYVFSLDMSTTASYRLCRIIQLIMEWSKTADDSTVLKTNLEARISREVKRCFDIYSTQRLDGDTNMEMMNILLTIDSSTDIKIPNMTLRELFHIENLADEEMSNLNYFQICTILLVAKDDAAYRDIHDAVSSHIPNMFVGKESLKRADMAQLFFDVCVCPFVERKIKMNVIQKALGITNRSRCSAWLTKLTQVQRWFFDWDINHEISRFLYKKEYHSPYE